MNTEPAELDPRQDYLIQLTKAKRCIAQMEALLDSQDIIDVGELFAVAQSGQDAILGALRVMITATVDQGQ